MNRSVFAGMWLGVVALMLASAQGNGQDAKPADAQPAAKAAPTKSLRVRSPYRPLAPGVMVSIDPMRALDETNSRHDIVGITAVDDSFDWAKEVVFRHDIWALKLRFKPMRMIWVDVPQPSGYMQRKPIWYIVYEITNTGKIMHPVEDVKLPYDTFEKKEVYEVKYVDKPIAFRPEFVLEGYQHMQDQEGFTKAYTDRVIPVAMQPIREREDPARKFLTTVEMCRDIPVKESVWGIAAWEDVDPRIVRFSVYVFGLTNAYRWKDEPGEYKQGETTLNGRKIYRKVLKLNFWRPADQFNETEKEIRYGIPDGVDYEWVYR